MLSVQASLDEPTQSVVMHRTEPSRLQSLALQLAEKMASLVDQNERTLEVKTSGLSYFNYQRPGTSLLLPPHVITFVSCLIVWTAGATPCRVQDSYTGVQGIEQFGTSIPGRRLQLGQRRHSPITFSRLCHLYCTEDKDTSRRGLRTVQSATKDTFD